MLESVVGSNRFDQTAPACLEVKCKMNLKNTHAVHGGYLPFFLQKAARIYITQYVLTDDNVMTPVSYGISKRKKGDFFYSCLCIYYRGVKMTSLALLLLTL